MKTVGALLAALPCGWGLGVVAAWLATGGEIGQLPALTVPFGLLATIVFALAPVLDAGRRLKILLWADAAFAMLGIIASIF